MFVLQYRACIRSVSTTAAVFCRISISRDKGSPQYSFRPEEIQNKYSSFHVVLTYVQEIARHGLSFMVIDRMEISSKHAFGQYSINFCHNIIYSMVASAIWRLASSQIQKNRPTLQFMYHFKKCPKSKRPP